MRIKTTKETALTFTLVVFFVFMDKLFKTLTLKGYLNEPVSLIKDIFTLHFTPNPNIAFSLPLSGPVLSFFIALVILILIGWWVKLLPISRLQAPDPKIYPLTILIFGAILNFTDRIKFGYVIDYFDLRYFTVFNIADIMITISVATILILLIKDTKNEH